jgi:MFS family permease
VLALIVRDPPGIAATKASAKIAGPSRAVIAPAPLSATLCIAIVCCCIAMSIPLIHIYPLALEQGLLPTSAAAVLSVIMVTSIVGRVGIGRLADHIGGVRSLLLASALQTAMVFWFSQLSTLPWFFAVGILYGIGYGGVIPSYAIIVREMIPTHRVGVVMGMVFFFGNLGMALGGYLGGVIYDLSGGYTASYATGALAGVANLAVVGGLLVVIRMRRPPIPAPTG